jgi:Single-strand binding protein family
MAERYSSFQDFDPEATGKALDSEPHNTRDVTHGDGQAFDLTDAVLEVYPDAGVTRATTPDARVELFRVPRYEVREQQVVFEQGSDDSRKRLTVSGDGKVSYRPVLRATEAPRTDGTTTDRPKDSPAGQAPSETVTGRNSNTPEPREAVPEVSLRGRLGRDPWFDASIPPTVGKFPLAVNPEDGGKATWHDVVVFDDIAEILQQAHRTGAIRKGRLVDVTGLPVAIERKREDGRARKVHEFHAIAVTRVQATRPGR